MEMIKMPKNNDVNAEPVVMTDEAMLLERMESQKPLVLR